MAMQDATPYHMRPLKEREQEYICMRQVFKAAPPVDFIYEAFGGTGGTAKELLARFPGAIIHAFDLDKECCDTYNKVVGDAQALCRHMDAREGLSGLALNGSSLGAVLDFNRFTIMDFTRPEGQWKRDLISMVMKRNPAWIEITDSAAPYLHVNYKRYGLSANNLQEYQDKLAVEIKNRWGYDLKARANHRAASYLLFEKDNRRAE